MGRCSDYILRGRTDCLHVFIHADNARRAKHVLERYGATEKPVEQRLKEMDNRRRNYYRFHTDRDGAYAATTTSRWTTDCSRRKNIVEG